MNEFMKELNEMKTIEFWNQFLFGDQKKISLIDKTTTKRETTIRDDNNDDNQKMSSSLITSSSSSGFLPLKPSFSSSSFFDIKTHPTIEDQVVLCRQIARQLVCDESNAKSKGREMFEKRVRKSYNWITSEDNNENENQNEFEFEFNHQISDGPPNLKLVLDPRHVQDLNSLDFEANEKEFERNYERSKSISKDIVEEVTSPQIKSKGNLLFAKRQEKSQEWIVESQDIDEKTNTVPLQPLLPTTPVQEEPKSYSLRQQNQLILSPKFRDFNARARPYARPLI